MNTTANNTSFLDSTISYADGDAEFAKCKIHFNKSHNPQSLELLVIVGMMLWIWNIERDEEQERKIEGRKKEIEEEIRRQ